MNKLSQKTVFAGIFTASMLAAGITHAQNDVSKQIDALIRSHKLNDARIGIEIAAVNNPYIVYQKNENDPLVPASNNKIITTAAALDMLGKDFCHTTTFFGIGGVDEEHGTFNGDICVKGDGDPNISGRFHDNNPAKIFEDWAKAVKNKGITAINGNLILDDTAFDREFTSPQWLGEDMTKWYTAPVSALSLNDNCIDLTISPGTKAGNAVNISLSPDTKYVILHNKCTTTADKKQNSYLFDRNPGENIITLEGRYYIKSSPVTEFCTIHDPTMYFGCVLWETLAKNGISINGSLIRGKADPKNNKNATVFAELRTPITTTLAVTNKKSQNFYAEQLLKTLGYKCKGLGSFNNGIEAVNAFLKKAGVDKNAVAVKDGSGLSNQNRQTADSIARVLWYMYHSATAREFIASLAQSGEDNTGLEKRLTDKPGKVFAKTGYISGSCCLSGYVQGKSGEMYIFSILVNNFKGGAGNVKDFQDAVCRLLTEK